MRGAAAFWGLVWAFCAQAEMGSTSSIEAVQEKLDQADADTLVIVDCDDTLVHSKDLALRTASQKALEALAKSPQKSSQGKALDLRILQDAIAFAPYLMAILRDAVLELLNPEWPRILSSLQRRGVKVLLFSSCLTGRRQDMEEIVAWRYAQLRDLGMDFRESWEGRSRELLHIEEAERSSALDTECAIFENGLLLCCLNKKGEALLAFLKATPQHSFKKIIFVDDCAHNVKSVGKAAHAAGLSFVGIEYTYEKSRTPPLVDLPVAQEQWHGLMSEKRWLSDAAAKARIQQAAEQRS
jgi:FMN phosphatase YigB (HAD superfamily)